MAVKTILKHARSVRKSGQNYIAMAHRLWREHVAEGLELASYQTVDVAVVGALAGDQFPVHVVPADAEIVSAKVKGTAGTGSIKLVVGATDLFAATTPDGTLQSPTVASSALAKDNVVEAVTVAGTAVDVVVTLTYKRLSNKTR